MVRWGREGPTKRDVGRVSYRLGIRSRSRSWKILKHGNVNGGRQQVRNTEGQRSAVSESG
ncbi:hypothetical protein U1Q18_035914 [Sarracenia purpurea var. burkii]